MLQSLCNYVTVGAGAATDYRSQLNAPLCLFVRMVVQYVNLSCALLCSTSTPPHYTTLHDILYAMLSYP